MGKKDINLLPEEYRSTTSKPIEGSEGIKIMMELVSSVASSIQNAKNSRIFSKVTFKGNISDKTPSIPRNLLKSRLKNLEKLLGVRKRNLISSCKENNIYNTGSSRMVIIDMNKFEEPCTVTIKVNETATIKCVKFFNDTPYLFPLFDENGLSGNIIYIDSSEIWYLDKYVATLVLFRDEIPDFFMIDLHGIKHFGIQKAVLNYIECCKMLYLDPNLNDLITNERKIPLDNILRIRQGYVLYKEDEKTYKVMLFDGSRNLTTEFTLYSLPYISEDAWDILFSESIYKYIKDNNYSFDNFRLDHGYLEYWDRIGSKDVCVMRCQI